MNKHFINNFPNLTIEKKLKAIIVLMLHHIVSAFMFFGSILLLNNKIKSPFYIYLFIFFNILIIIHWKTNNNRCIFTELQNNILNIDINDGFRNLHNIILNNYPRNNISNNISNNSYLFYFIVTINILFSIKILYT